MGTKVLCRGIGKGWALPGIVPYDTRNELIEPRLAVVYNHALNPHITLTRSRVQWALIPHRDGLSRGILRLTTPIGPLRYGIERRETVLFRLVIRDILYATYARNGGVPIPKSREAMQFGAPPSIEG